jgi:hypothetical protein
MTIPNQKTLFEIIRLLIRQVNEEKNSRQILIRSLRTEESKPVAIPTDVEVNARILELKNLLTTKTKEGKI